MSVVFTVHSFWTIILCVPLPGRRFAGMRFCGEGKKSETGAAAVAKIWHLDGVDGSGHFLLFPQRRYRGGGLLV